MKDVQVTMELTVPRTMTNEDIAQAVEMFLVAGSREWGVGWDENLVDVVGVKRLTTDMEGKRVLGARA